MHRAVSCRQVLGQYGLRHYIIKHSTAELEFHLEGEKISQYASAHRARTNSAQMLQWETTAALLPLLATHTSQSSQDYSSSLLTCKLSGPTLTAVYYCTSYVLFLPLFHFLKWQNDYPGIQKHCFDVFIVLHS